MKQSVMILCMLLVVLSLRVLYRRVGIGLVEGRRRKSVPYCSQTNAS